MKHVTIAELIDYLNQFRSRTTVMDGSEDRPYDDKNFVDLAVALDAIAGGGK